jgi:hypothetical protein
MLGAAPSMLHGGKLPRSMMRRLGPNGLPGKLPLCTYWLVNVGKGLLGLIVWGKEMATMYTARGLSVRGGKGTYVNSSSFAHMIRAR